MYKILIPEDIAPSGKEYLRKRGYTLKVGVPTDVDSLKREVADADALIVRNAHYPREVIEAGRALKVIARHGTGVDNIDVQAAEERGVYVVNGPTANVHAVAEYTIALLLALSCNLLEVDRHTREGDWQYRLRLQRRELPGQTLGLVGFGRISRLVAQKATAGLGMRVLAYDIRPGQADMPNVTLTDDLDEVVRTADYLSVHVPSTPQTRGMFDYRRFCSMKPTASFINCARGDVYVEEDLVRALREGRLAAAALDVYRSEPLPGDSPLLGVENLLLSQHDAGLTEEAKEKMSLHAAMGVDDVLMGREPEWPVNRPKR